MKKFFTLFVVAAILSHIASAQTSGAVSVDDIVSDAVVSEQASVSAVSVADIAVEQASVPAFSASDIVAEKQQPVQTQVNTPEVFFPYRNQISLSYGDGYVMPVVSLTVEAVGTAFAAILIAPIIAMCGGKTGDIDLNIGDVKTFGMANFGYRHFLPGDRFAMGFDLSYSRVQRRFEKTTTAEDGTSVTNITKTDSDLFYASFGATCYYKRRGWCKMYCSADVGIVASPTLPDAMAIYQHKVGFAYDFTPFGIQMGNDRVSGFAEVSFGYKGLLRAGIHVSM